MISNLASDLLGSTRRIGIFALVLVGIAYGTGFLIFNMYLDQLGAVSFEIVHTRFLSTGILYLFIQSIAVLTALISASPVLYALDQLHDLHQQDETYETRRASVRFLVVGIASFVVLFILLEMGAASVTAQLLAWTTRGVFSSTDLWPSIRMMNLVQGASAILVFIVVIEMRSRLYHRLALAVTMSALTCALSAQVYLLLAYTAQVYPLLSPTVGGGRPYAIRIVTKEVVVLTRLGISMEQVYAPWENQQDNSLTFESVDEEFGANSREEQQRVSNSESSTQMSEWITLLDERPNSYLVAPCLPQDLTDGCPAVQVDRELVLGLMYWPQLPVISSVTPP